MTDKFTPDWPHGHETVEGRAAEIFCARDGRLWGRVKSADDTWFAAYWALDGTACVIKSCYSLRNRPNPAAVKPIFEERWVNVYEDSVCSNTRETKEKARLHAAWVTTHTVPCFLISKSLAETGRDEFPAAVREWALPTSQNVVIYAAICDFLSRNPEWLIIRRPGK